MDENIIHFKNLKENEKVDYFKNPIKNEYTIN